MDMKRAEDKYQRHRTSTGGNSENEGIRISFSAQIYFSPCPRKNFSMGREK
jgi:hypothetical protein